MGNSQVGKFRELKVWEKGKDLAVWVYQITSSDQYQHIEQNCAAIARMLNRLIQARQSNPSPPKT